MASTSLLPRQKPGSERRCRRVEQIVARKATAHQAGYTLVELLVVIAIISALIALLLPAVQKTRETSNRMKCLNNLKQVGIALHGYHDTYQTFPHAYDARALFLDPSRVISAASRSGFVVTQSWATLILPFVEQANVQMAGYDCYHEQHVPLYVCPSDPRATSYYLGNKGFGLQSLTDYLAVTGTTTFNGDPRSGRVRPKCNGVMYESSRTRMADITDGTSSTVLVGERPPSPDLFWGWWTWSAFDASLGVRDNFAVYTDTGTDPPISCTRFFPENYRPSGNNYCDTHHFWSTHPGGGNWLFADGSVRFLSYQSNPILPALATRNGGEVVSDGG